MGLSPLYPWSDERFARQYRYELPTEFPLSLFFLGIVHHLSGPNIYTLTFYYLSLTHLLIFQ